MKKTLLLCLLAALAVAAPARAEAPPVFDRAQRADGARIAPDRFLRAYDPLTIFFPGDTGPKNGAPEDLAARYASITPQPAGEWRWVGPRALQFRPAEPWTPLSRIVVKSGSAEQRLVTLLPTPTSTTPAADAEPVPELTQIALTFGQPVDAAALARLVSVELRPAPGVSPLGGQVLSPAAYDLRALERSERNAEQTYVLRLRDSISDGRVAIVRLKLSDEPGLDDETYELRVRTALPFAVDEASCGRGWDDTQQGDVLRCAANGEAPAAPESGAEEGGDAQSTYVATNKRRLTLAFNAELDAPDILRARDALRLTPPVDDLAVEADGAKLKVSGKFLSDTVYELAIAPGSLKDKRGRPLAQAFTQRFAFTRDAPALQWDAGYGLVERLGAQLLPLRGRGYDRADIRIHAIDPLARDFWPFPAQGVETQDAEAPPLPGNEPTRWSESANIEADAIKARIKILGSPAVSRLVDLPIRRNGPDAKFGVDLKEDFARIAGREQPGAYLVGLRAPDSDQRKWLRVQVTDLSLSAIEEPTRVRFALTSLATAQPVAGAQIRVEGVREDKFITLASGATDSEGFFSWTPTKRGDGELRRVVAIKGTDTLVIDPDSAPSEYAKELWSKPEQAWLSWTGEADTPRAEKARTLCHIFSERPIYRPEEPAHIKGFVRSYKGGALSLTKKGGTLVVTGPNNQEWRIPVKLDGSGNFYHKFDAQTPATGDYAVKYEPDAPKAKKTEAVEESEDADSETADVAQDISCGQFTFKKEAYRLPTFEVVLNAPQTVALDTSFDVDLLARYFAGGLAADRPVKWRAAQFPHVFTPPNREGFLFSTDARFSSDGKFKSTAVLERDQRTDAGGAARMTFDTTIEPTAQPRRYSIEATVTGDDGVEVRNVQNVIALPPFVLGVKTPRYVERPGAVTPEIIAVDGKGEAIAGLDMTLRLIRRNWISTLQASDFAQGAAKYVTQVQDETVLEKKVTSTKEAQKIALEVKSAGVYVVQLEAYDRLKRRQQASVDFFVGGDTPVTFARPPAASATVTADKEKYAPGETATLVIQSPFQNARALAIVEQPNGVYDYSYVDIANGFGRFTLPVKKEQTPKLAVHFLIMRGRLKDSAPQPASAFDQGKPVTIAATKWIEVTPVKNIVNVKLEHPAKARPGQEVEVTLRLTDDAGRPVAGDATFWLVDQAVLSLAKERPLDPLPDFIVARETTMAARDTRNMAFGVIPLEEIAGGDGDLQEWGAENNISVRKNFTPVPIYLPSVKVGDNGVAKIKFTLPDTLTIFKLRAKAVSGPDRFGAAGSEMLIRQELVAQPALPRFIRPGDAFDIGLVARIVEGPGGVGKASIAAPALKLAGDAARRIDWTQNKPVRFDLRAEAPTSIADSTKLNFRIERDADHARDAVEVDLPVKPDREPTRRYEVIEIAPGETKTIAATGQTSRPGTFSRDVVVAADPALVKLVAGLTMLVDYPYGCTEQRLALGRAALSLKGFSPILSAAGLQDRVGASVRSAATQIDQSIDSDGLVAFWPRARGNVLLTAWAYDFLARAERAGEPVDKTLQERLGNILRQSLRSDYPHLIGGQELRERAAALAALAEGGKLDDSYVAELSRRADFLPNESVAEMAAAAARLPNVDQRILASLMDTMWSRVKFASRNGAQVYAGQLAESAPDVVLPSETRSLAEMLRAAALAAPADPRAPVLRDALLRLGEGDGWGSTNANASAIEALAEAWKRPVTPLGLTFSEGGAPQQVVIDANNPVARHVSATDAPLTIANTSNAPLIALVETRSMSDEPGAKAQAASEGFVITRQSWRVKNGQPPEKLDAANGVIRVNQGDVIEETAEVVNPEDRTYVAISLPLAAGYEPLNPNIATAPAEAQPSSAPTLAPTWVSYGDDRVLYAYDSLPKGAYRFAFRLKAQTAGAYTQPPALAETMYKKGLRGASAGARVEIVKQP